MSTAHPSLASSETLSADKFLAADTTHQRPASTPHCASPEILPTDKLLTFLQEMLYIRRMEERAVQLYTMGKIGGFCHVYVGQESIAVAASAAMGPQDTLITSYRCHGHMLARGASPRSVLGELLGKSSGCSKGKGGSMHMFHTEGGFYGGHGIVGAQTALGTGIALAHQYRKDGGVCLAFLGDGATNQGQFFESMNMAGLWNLPILYVIENNEYSMGTSVERGCAGGGLYQRALPFGLSAQQIESHDIQALYAAFSGALAHIRRESRPMLLEILTHRFHGHSVTDPGKYRTKDHVETLRGTRDPILCLQNTLLERGCPQETLDSLNDTVKNEIKAVVTQVEQDLEPSLEELYTDVLR